MNIKRLFIAVALASFALSTHAALIWDQSPAAVGGVPGPFPFLNQQNGQNFSDPVRFGTAQIANGMDLYIDGIHAAVGDSVVVSFRSGAFTSLPVQFLEVITIEDSNGVGSFPADFQRVHVDFTAPILLLANTTYWFGMAGPVNDELSQITIVNGTGPLLDNVVHTYHTLVYSHDAPGDMAFRLYGVPAAIPEPSTHALMLGCLGIMGFLAIRRKNRSRLDSPTARPPFGVSVS